MNRKPIGLSVPYRKVKQSMTQDEIIEMARQAGLMAFKYPALISKGDWQNLEAFAKLVAAKEREACAKLCEVGLPIATSLNALDEMEMWGEKFAAAIRARGEA